MTCSRYDNTMIKASVKLPCLLEQVTTKNVDNTML